VKILVVDLGVPAAIAGFRKHLTGAGHTAEAIEATARSEPLPPARRWDGIVLSGSHASVYEPEPWMGRVADWAFEAAMAGTGILGVCFGHQLMGWRLGGTVAAHPAGPECGTGWVDLTPAGLRDPVFSGIAPRLRVQQAHGDHLVVAPTAEGTQALATSEHTPLQAFRWRNVVGVQFHPEVDPILLGTLLAAEGWSGECGDAREAERVIVNWAAQLP
jgi:GMP synthase (glutamine-hydrolysing)